MKKRAIFAAIVAALLLSYSIFFVFFMNEETFEISKFGHALFERVNERVTEKAAVELEHLFHVLDENKDGVLQLDEFKDRRVAIAAAMFAARREIKESLSGFDPISDLTKDFKLPSPPTRIQIFSFFLTWFQLQILFCMPFLFYENLIAVITQNKPRQLKLDDSYLDAKPTKVDPATAIKYSTPLAASFYEKAKMFFFIVSGIAFTRLIVAVLFFFIALIFINVSVVGGRNRRRNPLWFGACEMGVQLCGYGLLCCLGFYCVKVYGQPAKNKDVKLLIGNHTCVIEVIVLFLQSHMPSFVSRVENLAVPGFRGLATATNSIMVNRDAADSRSQTLDTIKARAGDVHAEQLMLFPEGTCNVQGGLFMFKKGAFEAGEPVQMAAFAFPYKHFNMSWSGRCAGGNDALDLFVRMCCQFVNRCEVRFLPVYYPSQEEKADPCLYASHCQSMIARTLGLPISDATFNDYKALEVKYASRKNQNERFTYVSGDEKTQQQKQE